MKDHGIPPTVRTVARLLLLYAGIVLLATLGHGLDTGFEDRRELLRGLVRAAGFSYLAWWLPSLDTRAWWVTVFACGLLAVIGVVGLALSLGTGILGPWRVLALGVSLYAVGHAFLLLMRSDTRQQFGT